MADNEDNQSIVGNNEDTPSNLMSEIQKLRNDILEVRQGMASETLPREILEDQQKMTTKSDEKMKSQEQEYADILEKLQSIEDLVSKNQSDPVIEVHAVLPLHKSTDSTPEIVKSFFAPNRTDLAETMNYCFKKSLAWGSPDFISWEEVEKNYLVDGNLTAEVHVKILETKGLRKEKIRSFDGSVKEVSDVVLIVKDQKFHVHRTYIAAQSSFFRTLFLGESKKTKFIFTGIDPEDFHYFLEVLYGEAAIDESTVEGIAFLAYMYDAPTAIRRCEEFILKESKKTLKKKLQMATRYNMEKLKKKCLDDIKTAQDIRSVVPMDVQDLDHSVTTDLLKKALSLLS